MLLFNKSFIFSPDFTKPSNTFSMAFKKVLEGFSARNTSGATDTDDTDKMDYRAYEFYYL